MATPGFSSNPNLSFDPSAAFKTKIPFVGTDMQTGKRGVDLSKQFDFGKIYQGAFSPAVEEKSKATGELKDGKAIPPTEDIVEQYQRFAYGMAPLQRQQTIEAAEISAALTGKQLSQLYPYLSAAGAEATARSLAASKAFRAFKEQMPSSVQDIMASKQAQATSAASAEAARQQATALQQQAAKDFAGRYSGQYVSYA
jgi:hypothetical protein